MHRDARTQSDPATRSPLHPEREVEETGDPDALHQEPLAIERMISREPAEPDEATVGLHARPDHELPADPQVPEELPGVEIALATQGGGSFSHEDAEPSLEAHVDRDALAAGIVPQLVSQATIESAEGTRAIAEDVDDVDEDAETLPRARTHRVRSAARVTRPATR